MMHFTVYTNIKLSCTPETKINIFIPKKKKKKNPQKTHIGIPRVTYHPFKKYMCI